MKNIFFIISIVALLFASQKAKAQLPVNDAGWILQDGTGGTLNLSDEFNGSSLDGTKWYASDSFPISVDPVMAFNRPNHNNITFSGTAVTLKADTLVPARTHTISTSGGGTTTLTCHYQGSLFQSNNFSFKYGYLEINAKAPQFNNAFWPAFWTWDDSCANNWYNEIDIFENGPPDSGPGYRMGTNIHWNTSGCDLPVGNNNPYSQPNLPQLNSAFHKYGIEWNSKSVTWYFDDTFVRSDTITTQMMLHYAAVILNLDISAWEPAGVLNKIPVGGDVFTIDYFRYYKLTAHCGSSLTICSPISYDRGVYQTITTGGSGCGTAPTFNTSSKYTLRATDSVILDAGTVINADGSGQFTVLTTPCPN